MLSFGQQNPYKASRAKQTIDTANPRDMSKRSAMTMRADFRKSRRHVLKAGKIFGQANTMYATGHALSADAKFFQNGKSNDGYVPPGRGGGRGFNPNAPPHGETPQ